MKINFPSLALCLAVLLTSSCTTPSTPVATGPELGLQAWTFRKLTFVETLDQAHALGIRYVQAYPGQELGGGLSGKFDHTMVPATLTQVLALAKSKNVIITSYGVVTPKNDDEWPALLAFAQAAGLREIVTEAKPETLVNIAPAVAKTSLKISLHNHPTPNYYAQPTTGLAAVASLGNQFGLCADTGHWARTGLDPVETLKLVKGRINSLHFKDILERGQRSRDLPWGTGTSDAAGQLAELRRQGFNGILYVEYEHLSPQLVDDLTRCVDFFKTAMTLSVDELARGLIVPTGYSADAHAVFAPDRGQNSARWPAPQPLFARDLSNADLQPGAWAFNPDGFLAPTRTVTAKGTGDIWTKESYGDFVLSLEFRAPENANSGVFLRCTDIVNWLQNSLEIQIRQGDEKKPANLVGALFDVAAPKRQVPITPGEWYRYVLYVKGSSIRVLLNGETINTINLDEWTQAGLNPDGTTNKFKTAYKDMARVGRIGLQDHGGPIVEFRNLLIEPY